MGDGKLMIIEKTGITAQTHGAMGVWLDETYGLTLMGSSVLWIQVDRDVTEDELAGILALDVTILEEEAVPKTQDQIIAELQLQMEMQEELLSILLGE